MWLHGGTVEYDIVAKHNYAMYLLRSKPVIPRNHGTALDVFPLGRFPRARGHHKARRKRSFRSQIIERDGTNCFYCGEPMTEEDMTLEHLVARSLNGQNTLENIVLAHSLCNNRAGVLPLHDKLALKGRMERPKNGKRKILR